MLMCDRRWCERSDCHMSHTPPMQHTWTEKLHFSVESRCLIFESALIHLLCNHNTAQLTHPVGWRSRGRATGSLEGDRAVQSDPTTTYNRCHHPHTSPWVPFLLPQAGTAKRQLPTLTCVCSCVVLKQFRLQIYFFCFL